MKPKETKIKYHVRFKNVDGTVKASTREFKSTEAFELWKEKVDKDQSKRSLEKAEPIE
jgi:hypothetical protein